MTIFIGIVLFIIGFIVGGIAILTMYAFGYRDGRNKIIEDTSIYDYYDKY